jgi:hypothetical protein
MVNLNKEILDCLNKKGYSWAKIVYSEELVIKVAIEKVSKFVRRKINKTMLKAGFSDGIVDRDDIEQAVAIGVVKALENYDAEFHSCARRTQFTSYAYNWVCKYLRLLDRDLDYAFVDEKGTIYTTLDEFKHNNGKHNKIRTIRLKSFLSSSEDEESDIYEKDGEYFVYRRKKNR